MVLADIGARISAALKKMSEETVIDQAVRFDLDSTLLLIQLNAGLVLRPRAWPRVMRERKFY